MVKAVVDAVGNRPVGEKRCLAAFDRVNQHFFALDVEVGFVLTGKTGVGQVFSGGGTAHRHAQMFATGGLERAPGFAQLLLHGGRHGRTVNNLTRPGTGTRQRIGIGLVQRVEQAVQLGPGIGRIKRRAVRHGGDGKPIRHPHTQRCELLEHLAQRSIFATDQRDVGQREFSKPADIAGGSGRHGDLLNF